MAQVERKEAGSVAPSLHRRIHRQDEYSTTNQSKAQLSQRFRNGVEVQWSLGSRVVREEVTYLRRRRKKSGALYFRDSQWFCSTLHLQPKPAVQYTSTMYIRVEKLTQSYTCTVSRYLSQGADSNNNNSGDICDIDFNNNDGSEFLNNGLNNDSRVGCI